MRESLHYQQMQDFSLKHPDESFYELDIDGTLFGFFYVSPAVSTLIWQGAFEFSSLNYEAFESLPSQIDTRWTQSGPFSPLDRRIATFFLEARDLVEYNLNDPEQDYHYRSTVEKAYMISFARYDVRKVSGPVQIEYSFTAENPQWSPTHGSELTVMLPKSQPWTETLMDWVIERHVKARITWGQVDPQDFVNTLSILGH